MRKLLFLLPLVATACSYPATTISTVVAHPALRVLGATPTAALLIDSQQIGLARFYGEGGHALDVAHGTHRVEIRDGAAVLYSGDVYFGDDTTKTITLDSVAQ